MAGSDGGDGGPSSLREQHHGLTRQLILRSVAEQLGKEDLSDITVPAVAQAAGISVRTIYRHFPTREDLIAAAAEWIFGGLFFSEPGIPEKVDELAAHTAANLKSFDKYPNLGRALALTRAGNAVRSVRRQHRLEGLQRALKEVMGNLSAAEQRRAEAVFGYLSNVLAWVTMRDENAFSGEEIGKAIGWAMEVLIDDLRRRNEAAGA